MAAVTYTQYPTKLIRIYLSSACYFYRTLSKTALYRRILLVLINVKHKQIILTFHCVFFSIH